MSKPDSDSRQEATDKRQEATEAPVAVRSDFVTGRDFGDESDAYLRRTSNGDPRNLSFFQGQDFDPS